ncbi:MAG: cadherin domain-containing protein [Candidatus Poribacteria bacterium]|nr:cadherin domain-containing protein [Candidatus Poribacteria bacterium]
MKLFIRKQRSTVFFLLTLLILFGTSNTGYTQADENRAPVFNEGARATRTVAENTPADTNIGAPFTATDPDNGDTLTYSLHRGDRNAFRINPNTGQLQTRAALDYETKNAYNNLTVRATDSSGLTDAILVTINVTNVNEMPTFNVGGSRTVAENTAAGTNIGEPFTATDPDGDALTYSLYSGADRHAFSIVSTTGQLQTKDALDYETQNAYTFIISVSDGNGGILARLVTINVTDVEETLIMPVNQRTRQVRDAIVDAVPDVNNPDEVTPEHLAGITKLDLSNKGIRSLKSSDFSGLSTLTNLNLQNNSITDIAPLEDLTTLTWLYLNNTSISDISALEDLTSLTYLNLGNTSISDISALENLTSLTSLFLSDTSISDISALENLTFLTGLWLNNTSISDISALENLTSVALLNLSGASISDISALENLTSLLWLLLEGNPISDYGPLRRLMRANWLVSIDININNNIPVFSDGDSTTRSVAENTEAGINIGAAVSATDADNHTLTYSLGGTDADAFDIVTESGQLQTKAALDADTKSAYTVTVTVYDGNSGGDRITVTIDVTESDDENVRGAPSVEVSPIIPDRTALLTNFPNPFNPETWIPYQLAKPAEVTLTIYDIRGVVVRELKLGHQAAGMYHSRSRAIYWDGSNTLGEKVATGVYFYTLKAGDFTATRKLLIRK